jgi:hypothetical protein
MTAEIVINYKLRKLFYGSWIFSRICSDNCSESETRTIRLDWTGKLAVSGEMKTDCLRDTKAPRIV